MRQVSDLWATAGIASTVTNVIIFADARNPTATSPTMEGYITLIEGQNTQDAALFTMLCGGRQRLRKLTRRAMPRALSSVVGVEVVGGSGRAEDPACPTT